jgi:hypothetical protein
MPSAEHAAEEDQDELEIDRLLRKLSGNQPNRHEQIALMLAAKNLNDCSTHRWTPHHRHNR